MLVLMYWNARAPQDTMSVVTRLYIDEQGCESVGRQTRERVSSSQAERQALEYSETVAMERFAWSCQPHGEPILVHPAPQE